MAMLNGCASSLGSLSLLHPLDVFINVSYGALWQKHVAWGTFQSRENPPLQVNLVCETNTIVCFSLLWAAAKPEGDELRHYITSRYSTNMVLLSLLLATEIQVFFNSSHEHVQMRTILSTTPIAWDQLQFWIGLIILLDVCVTLMGLIATFTLWGMISAISDSNSHCLLRSSLGQYVTSLPPRFSLASIYLFLLWILLFIIDLVVAPLAIILVALACTMFFAIVLPLSAFGRLIMDTGAMSRRPVLSPDLEKDLLPSGLQASLLIRATHRQRRNACVTTQYRRRQAAATARSPTLAERPSFQNRPGHFSHSDDDDELPSVRDSIAIQGWLNPESAGNRKGSKMAFQNQKSHRRLLSGDTTSSEAILFPHASILNATISRRELRELIETSVTKSSSSQPIENTPLSRHRTASEHSNGAVGDNTASQGGNANRNISRPNALTRHHRRVSSSARGLLSEWVVESDVRDQYGARPPADLPSEIDIGGHMEEHDIEENSWSPWRKSPNFLPFLQSPKDDEEDVAAYETKGPPSQPTLAGTGKAKREGTNSSSLTQPLLPRPVDLDDGSRDDSSTLFGEDIPQPNALDKRNEKR
eukprot:scaffold4481_cov121-Cylindrotheca_fusiformis.AAC.7